MHACDIPIASGLEQSRVDAAYFCDAYRAPLSFARSSPVDCFFAIFGHRPGWMDFALNVRNRAASLAGLEAATSKELRNVERKHEYAVGDKIGVWPIFALTDTELIAGRNNSHLDFRLSVLKEGFGEASTVVVSTVCNVHNTFGKIYLCCVIPFHKWGLQLLIRRAVLAGRL